MTLQSWLTAYWQPVLIGAVLGLILGWLIFGLRSRGPRRQLEASLQSAQSKAASAEKALNDAKQQAQTAQANLDQARNQLVAWQTSYQALQDDRLAIEGQIKEGDDRYTALQQEKETLQSTLDNTTLDLTKALQNLDAAAETIANQDTALNDARDRAAQLQSEISEQQQLAAATLAELASLRRETALLGAANQDMDRRLHNARGEVAGELAVLTTTMLKIKDDALVQANAAIALLTAQLEELGGNKPAVG